VICSFCEQLLMCKACGKPFETRRAETFAALGQADMEIRCPECQKILVCRLCGYPFGEDDDAAEG